MQRATWLDLTRSALLCYFYPRSRGFGCLGGGISIHALLAESDNRVRLSPLGPKYFYPRSPCGERHELSERRWRPSGISIHALLAESDRCCPCAIIAPAISIHALLAESDKVVVNKSHKPHGFLSTLSLRRATHALLQGHFIVTISIHALLAESDTHIQKWVCIRFYFYPRSPCGERLSSWTFSTFTNRISIHALLAESDQVSAGAVAHGEGISIHALLAESDRPGPR